ALTVMEGTSEREWQMRQRALARVKAITRVVKERERLRSPENRERNDPGRHQIDGRSSGSGNWRSADQQGKQADTTQARSGSSSLIGGRQRNGVVISSGCVAYFVDTIKPEKRTEQMPKERRDDVNPGTDLEQTTEDGTEVHEAEEVMRCMRKGLKESPFMPLEESLQIMRIMDQIRAPWGLTYSND
ncbi:MAG: hypothetical protein U9R60_05965, partial [Bacteroidota bacterium]|nr:hypothetical protein [Bacteroidota bacterium]